MIRIAPIRSYLESITCFIKHHNLSMFLVANQIVCNKDADTCKRSPIFGTTICTIFFDERGVLLSLTKTTNLIILSANDYRTSQAQILDLAGHMGIPITAGPTTSWGMSISRSLIERLRQEQIPT